MRFAVFGAVLAAAIGSARETPAQETQTYTYDVHGRLLAVARNQGAAGRTTSYTLDDADNRVGRVTVVGGAVATAEGIEAAASSPPEPKPKEPDAVVPQAADTPAVASRGQRR